jgi:hypothetical protein
MNSTGRVAAALLSRSPLPGALDLVPNRAVTLGPTDSMVFRLHSKESLLMEHETICGISERHDESDTFVFPLVNAFVSGFG